MKKTKEKKMSQECVEYLDYIEEQLESDSMSPEEAGFLRGTL